VREALEVGREFVVESAMLRSTEKDPVRAALALCSGEIHSIIDGLDQAGYVIVPKEPTEKMIAAGLIPTAAWQDIKGSALTVNREKMRMRYTAMVKAWTEDR
jgi:hypothetical protein